MKEIAWHAARDFARRLRDPAFRTFAADSGYRPDRELVLALEDEPVMSVLDRVARQATGAPVTVVVYRPDTTHGFTFVPVAQRVAA